jgi:hypothetical protein
VSDRSRELIDLLNKIDGELAQAMALADAMGAMSAGLVAARRDVGFLIVLLKSGATA